MLSLLRHCYVMQPALRCAPMQTADRKNSTLLLGWGRCIGQLLCRPRIYAGLTEKALGRKRAYLPKPVSYGIYNTRLRVGNRSQTSILPA